MQSTQLGMCGQGLEGHDFQCNFLNNHQFAKIHIIALTGNFTTPEIMRFMLLPNATALQIEYVALLRAPRLASSYTTLTSKLTSLSLVGGDNWNAAPEVIGKILLICPRLQELHCQVSKITMSQNGRALGLSSVSAPASPVAFDLVFLPLRTTLRKLSLLQIRHHVPCDGTHMDLSGFRNLIELETTSCCLLPSGPPC
jgi:hypothetical protein